MRVEVIGKMVVVTVGSKEKEEEKKLVAEIKRTAKTGNEVVFYPSLLFALSVSLSVGVQQGAMHAQSSIAVGMKGATKAMSAMNKQRASAKQMQMVQDFQGHSAQMDMTTEMMSDTIVDALDNDEAEDETEELTNQVLDKIGVDGASQLSAAPKGKLAGKRTENVSSSGINELEERLAALRNA
ncbi:hypothetical protein Ancab_019693 [Ancistrocladus abbreviatus]